MSDQPNWVCFQYFKEQGYPVYIRYDQNLFSVELKQFLKEFQFTELEAAETEKIEQTVNRLKNSRLLTLEVASPHVVAQIDQFMDTDIYGYESITPKESYKVYRYKGEAVMVYSFVSKFWRIGVFEDFAVESNNVSAKSIINRYLSWALAPLGVVGFWGVPVDEGIVIFKQSESSGEAVFVDVNTFKVLSIDGVRRIRGRFQVLRLDSTLKGRNLTMNREELLSFLTQYCSYFDYVGPSVPVRQMIQALSRLAVGLIHPRESFKPRTDLSL
jgi:hypothetical protein